MATTIRNPVEWSADQLKGASHHLGSAGESLGARVTDSSILPAVRHIDVRDLGEVLRRGVEDFAACRTDVAFLVLIYPVAGIVLTLLAFHQDFIHLVFPAMAGFALIGPAAAVGLYELSRRREEGRDTNWGDALGVFASPSLGAILALGILLLAIFVCWILVAYGIYALTLGPEAPVSARSFALDVLNTGAGWTMIGLGFAVGFLFAALVLAISVVSFPLLLDRNVGLPAAIVTSVRVAAASPVAIGAWGLIVALSLAVATIPAFLGLIIVMPVLGQATWHLYRRTVVREGELS